MVKKRKAEEAELDGTPTVDMWALLSDEMERMVQGEYDTFLVGPSAFQYSSSSSSLAGKPGP